jgi:hypothetical protein
MMKAPAGAFASTSVRSAVACRARSAASAPPPVVDLGVRPRPAAAEREAADDAVRELVAGLAEEDEVRAERRVHERAEVGGRAAPVVELLDRDEVRLQSLEDAEARILVLLAVAGEVGRHDAEGGRVRDDDGRGAARQGQRGEEQQAQPEHRRQHGRRPPPGKGRRRGWRCAPERWPPARRVAAWKPTRRCGARRSGIFSAVRVCHYRGAGWCRGGARGRLGR